MLTKHVLQWYNELIFCQKGNSTAGSGGSPKSHFFQLILERRSHCPLKIQLEGVWSVKMMNVKDKWSWRLQKTIFNIEFD